MTRKLHIPIGLILACLLTIPVHGAMAKDPTAYQAVEFSDAQKQQKHVVIEIFKKGCGTCAAQQPALEKARQKFPDAVFMKVDFEHDADAVTVFKAVKQSTIIIFKGETEVDRLVGVTDPSAILAAIAKGA
jgi:thiol-disulfide isomerase/thioredoxin